MTGFGFPESVYWPLLVKLLLLPALCTPRIPAQGPVVTRQLEKKVMRCKYGNKQNCQFSLEILKYQATFLQLIGMRSKNNLQLLATFECEMLFVFPNVKTPSMIFLAIITQNSSWLRLSQQLESWIVLHKCFTLPTFPTKCDCWCLPTNSLCSSDALCTWDVHPLAEAVSYSLGSEGNSGSAGNGQDDEQRQFLSEHSRKGVHFCGY